VTGWKPINVKRLLCYMSQSIRREVTAVVDYGEVEPSDNGVDSHQHQTAPNDFRCISKF